MSCNCNNCGASDTETCSCPAGLDGATIRFGDGVPTVLSTDQAGDIYIQNDSSPLAGEVWSFDGVSWTDEGFAMKGDTGADGSAGSAVIYNSEGTTTAFNSVGLTTIDTQNVTLDTDGSYIMIDNAASVTPNSANNRNRITVGGVVVWDNTPNVSGIANQKVSIRVSRVSATLIQWQNEIWLTNTWSLPIGSSFFYNISTDAVADMDTNPLTVLLQWGGIGTSKSLVITKFVK